MDMTVVIWEKVCNMPNGLLWIIVVPDLELLGWLKVIIYASMPWCPVSFFLHQFVFFLLFFTALSTEPVLRLA